MDERLLRADIRSDPSDGSIKSGVPLALALASRAFALQLYPARGPKSNLCTATLRDLLGCHGPKFPHGRPQFPPRLSMTDHGPARFATISRWYAPTVPFISDSHGARLGAGLCLYLAAHFDDVLTDRVYALAPYAIGATTHER